jgi:hypothetical protein
LAVVRILVAVRALCRLYFEPGIGAGRDVALVARNGRVFAEQWICGRGMFLHAKKTWLPSIHIVTLRTFAFFRTSLKLAVVRVWSMTIHALVMSYRRFEVVSVMTFRTAHGAMLSKQGKIRF